MMYDKININISIDVTFYYYKVPQEHEIFKILISYKSYYFKF